MVVFNIGKDVGLLLTLVSELGILGLPIRRITAIWDMTECENTTGTHIDGCNGRAEERISYFKNEDDAFMNPETTRLIVR
jgi:hypothetical protein